MKIITYNVNGIRSAINKGLFKWMGAVNADIVCLQEIKCSEEQIDSASLAGLGYTYQYAHTALKKGYSGVAIFSKIKPVNVFKGCGINKYDCEGRVLMCEFKTFSVMNVYMPSGSSGEIRQQFKFEWMDDFFTYLQKIKKSFSNLIVCGDFNICHESIDIHNPKANAKSSGFLPEERLWIRKLLDNGFVDTFRHFNQEPHHYTWWTYRAGARKKNLGWRIDYIIASKNLMENARKSFILPDAIHSDHCPVLFDFDAH